MSSTLTWRSSQSPLSRIEKYVETRLGTATSSAAAAPGNPQLGSGANPSLANDGSYARGRSGSTCGDSMSIASGASAPAERKKLKTGESFSSMNLKLLVPTGSKFVTNNIL